MDQKSIIDMAHGAFKERADYEMAKILENILDPNTKAEKKRSLTIQMTFCLMQIGRVYRWRSPPRVSWSPPVL